MSRTNGKLTVPCGCCNGTGRVPFTGVYADTLALLRRQAAPLKGAELAKLAGCKGSAMCNRLARLERIGFATSTRYGRERLWTAAARSERRDRAGLGAAGRSAVSE